MTQEGCVVREMFLAAYTVPTDFPESDGTLAWDQTTLILVNASAGDKVGIGYTYADLAPAQLINGTLLPLIREKDAMSVPTCWSAMRHAILIGSKLVDVRSVDEFTGKIIAPPGRSETAQRGGHSPAHQRVRAVGITFTVPQAEIARRRIQNSGLNDRCRVEVCDYREFHSAQQYDKLVSVRMFEHAGEALLPEYFARAWQLLRPGGVFLNHGIALPANRTENGPSFIDRYVFPDGELVLISASLGVAERSGFEIRDLESLREHYALTLHHWVRRSKRMPEEARRITHETTYRIWRLYMAASAHRFRLGQLNIYHPLLAKSLQGESGYAPDPSRLVPVNGAIVNQTAGLPTRRRRIGSPTMAIRSTPTMTMTASCRVWNVPSATSRVVAPAG